MIGPGNVRWEKERRDEIVILLNGSKAAVRLLPFVPSVDSFPFVFAAVISGRTFGRFRLRLKEGSSQLTF